MLKKVSGNVARLGALLLIIIMCTAGAQAQTHRGEKCFGVKIGYADRNKSVLGGLVFQYSFGKHVRIAPQVGAVLRHFDSDALLFDVDVHFPLSLGGDRAAFYPLVGVAYQSWADRYDSEADVTTRTNGMGANVGAGIEYRCKIAMKLSVEGRYTYVHGNPNFQVYAGIAYVF